MRRSERILLSTSTALVACAALVSVSTAAVAADGLRGPPGASSAKLSRRLAALSKPPLVEASPAEQARALGLPVSGGGSLIRSGRRVLVYVRLADVTTGARASVTDAGLRITHVAVAYRMVTGFVEPRRLAALAAVRAVQQVSEALRPLTNVGAPTTS